MIRQLSKGTNESPHHILNLCTCVYLRHTSFYFKIFNLLFPLYITVLLLQALRHI